MLGNELKIEKKEKATYNPLPEDVYQVELVDITAKESDSYDKKRKETVLDFQFTLLDGVDVDLTDLRGRNIWRNFVPTYLYEGKNGKNTLYQITEAILGRTLTDTEEHFMDGDFLDGLIGKQLRVVIVNTTKDGKTYSNIKSFLPKKEELPGLTAEEREKAMVKKKVEEPKEVQEEEIPTVNIEGI